METNTNAVVMENTDYADTKGEKISKLLWWTLGIAGARLLFKIYELTGGYVPVPNMGNEAVYLLISVFSTVTLITLGKYHKLYKIGGIIAAVGCVAKIVLPFVTASLPPATDFLSFLSEPTDPMYKLINSLSTYLPIIASIIVGAAHTLFSNPMNEKISKGWKIALIAYIAIYVINKLYMLFSLYIIPRYPEFSPMIYSIVIGLSEAVILAIYALQVVLLYFMATKAKEIE